MIAKLLAPLAACTASIARTVAVSYHVLFNLKIQRRFHASDAMLLVVTLRNWFFSCHHCIIVVMLHAMPSILLSDSKEKVVSFEKFLEIWFLWRFKKIPSRRPAVVSVKKPQQWFVNWIIGFLSNQNSIFLLEKIM